MVIFRFCHGDRDSYPCRPSFHLCSVLPPREVFRLRVCTELLSKRKYFRYSFMATLLRSKEQPVNLNGRWYLNHLNSKTLRVFMM